jgi:nucleoside-diphosphate-sugar epimerase
MDSGRLNLLGWYAKVDLEKGLKQAYENFLEMSDSSIKKNL